MSELSAGRSGPASRDGRVEAVIRATPQGQVVSWNRGAELLFGIPRREAIGSALKDLLAPLVQSGDGHDPPPAPRPQAPELPRRQGQILTFIADGLTTREIAARLGLSPKTVETHRSRLMRRLVARNLAELLRRALELGFVQIPPCPVGAKRRT